MFYEIFPASFQDSNSDGIGDLHGINNRMNYLKSLNVGAIRLNSIYPSKHYPENFLNITTYFSIDHHIGDFNDFNALVTNLHSNDIKLILDLPLTPLVKSLHTIDNTEKLYGDHESENLIQKAINFWLDKGVDGFYIKDLEHFHNDSFLLTCLKEWKYVLGSDRCLIVSSKLIDKCEHNKTLSEHILKYIDLIDMRLNVEKGTKAIVAQIEQTIKSPLGLSTTNWIHWNINSLQSERRFSSMAVILLELMLPGTPSLFYGDEISLTEVLDTFDEHKDTQHLHHLPIMQYNSSQAFTNVSPWLPKSKFNPATQFNHLSQIKDLIGLRKNSPAIYLKQISREDHSYANTNLRTSQGDLIVIERHYPRRKNYAYFANFGRTSIQVDLSSTFYSGDIVMGSVKDTKVYFDKFEINSLDSIIVKLDK